MSTAFIGYFVILAIEYLGLGYYLPFLIKLPLILIFILFLYVLSKYNVGEVLKSKQAKLFLFFIFLTFLSLFHGLIQSYAIDPLKQQIGYFVLFIIGACLLRNIRRIDIFVAFFVAIHSYIIFLNFDKLMMTERSGTFRAGYFLGDGNDLAWSLTIVLPFSLYLFFRSNNRIVKLVSAACFLWLLLGIIGSQSRGATLAMVASLFYFWSVVSKKKIKGFLFIAFLVFLVISLAPPQYIVRLGSISDYKEDSSAMGRIRAWKAATQMALDHPLGGVGAGSYNSAYGRFYKPEDAHARWISTHSIYFKVLGEYGFTGIIVFLLLIFSIYRENRKLKKLIIENQDEISIPYYWPDIINMSLIAYAAAGAFLTGLNYPHIYILASLTISAKYIAHREVENTNNVLKEEDAEQSKYLK